MARMVPRGRCVSVGSCNPPARSAPGHVASDSDKPGVLFYGFKGNQLPANQEEAVKTVATIEARMSSSRMPGKVLKPILGRPNLELLVERLRRAKRLDQIVLA